MSYYYASTSKPYIPEQWFVALHARKGGEQPLAFMVPGGDDQQAKDRKDTAKSWARGRRHRRKKDGKEPEFRTIEPEPQTGFVVADTVKRSGRESNRELFRVIDPRGFELEVDPSNFLQIMRNAFVDTGKIHTELTWVRSGSNNLLIPTDSDAYDEAIEETKSRRNDIGMGDIELGWTVRIQRGMKGKYLGRWDIIKEKRTRRRTKSGGFPHQHRYEWESEIEVNTNRRYAFLDDNALIIHGSPEPGTILEKGDLTYEEAAKIVNENVEKASRAGQGSGRRMVGFTRDRGDSLSVERTGGGTAEARWKTGESDEEFVKHVDV